MEIVGFSYFTAGNLTLKMSFRATIDSIPKHNAWYRGIYVLNTIDEKIKITIIENALILWAVHNTGSSCCQIIYDKSFFKDFEFKPNNVVFGEDGLQTVTDLHGIGHKIFSFEIDAKNLNMVSRKSDNDEIKEFTILIDNTTTCPDSLMNRLIVTITMQSLIVKDHTPLFTPIKFSSNRLDLQYKKKLLDVYGDTIYDNDELGKSFDPALVKLFKQIEGELSQSIFGNIIGQHLVRRVTDPSQLTEEDEINFISCNCTLIKNFVDNCKSNVIKDVKMELFENVLTLTGSRSDLKNSSEILQHGIIISNTIDTNDLGPYCIYNIEEGEEEEEERNIGTRFRSNGKYDNQKDELIDQKKRQKETKPSKKMIFTLKDFKSFINMATIWKNIDTPPGVQEVSNKEVNIWFCRPGQPILFQISKPSIQASLLLLTDGSGININQPIGTPFFVERQSPLKQKKELSPQRMSPNKKRSIEPDLNLSQSVRINKDYDMSTSTTMASISTRIPRLNPLEIRNNRISPLKVSKTPVTKVASPLKDGIYENSRSYRQSPRRLFVADDNSQEGSPQRMQTGLTGLFPSISRTSSTLFERGPSKSPKPRNGVADYEQIQRGKVMIDNLERTNTIVGWGRFKENQECVNEQRPLGKISRESSMKEGEIDRQRILRQEKMKYVNSKKKSVNKEKHKKDELPISVDDNLGPTQYNPVKGLFE